MSNNSNRVKQFIYFVNQIGLISNYYEVYESEVSTEEERAKMLQNLDIKAKTVLLNSCNYIDISEAICIVVDEIINSISSLYSDKQLQTYMYILCACADEYIISNTKLDAATWMPYSIENKKFMTSIAGDKVVYLIQDFIEMHSKVDEELNLVYYYLLCFGYKGKYKYEAHNIKQLQRRVYQNMNKEINLPLFETITQLALTANNKAINSKFVSHVFNYTNLYLKLILLTIFVCIALIIIIAYYGLTIIKSIK